MEFEHKVKVVISRAESLLLGLGGAVYLGLEIWKATGSPVIALATAIVSAGVIYVPVDWLTNKAAGKIKIQPELDPNSFPTAPERPVVKPNKPHSAAAAIIEQRRRDSGD